MCNCSTSIYSHTRTRTCIRPRPHTHTHTSLVPKPPSFHTEGRDMGMRLHRLHTIILNVYAHTHTHTHTHQDILHTPLQTQPSHSPPESTISGKSFLTLPVNLASITTHPSLPHKDGIEHKLTPSTPTPKKTRTPHRIGF